MQFYQIKVNPLTGLKKQVKCVFNPRSSKLGVIKHNLRNSPNRPNLPFKTEGYNFSIEYGLRPHSTTNWLNPKFFVVSSLVTALPLVWWLNNTNASVPPQPQASRLIQSYLVTVDPSSSQPQPFHTSVDVPVSISLLKQMDLPVVDLPIDLPVSLPAPMFSPETSSLPWLHLRVQTGDTLSVIFKKHKLNKAHLYQIIKIEQYAKQLRQLRIAQKLHIQSEPDGSIKNLILVLNKTEELHIYQDGETFDGEIRPIGTHTEIVTVHGKVKTSLSAAAQQAGLSKKLFDKFVSIFQWNIDFKHQVQAGDQFSVIYEQHRFGKSVERGNILAAEFINQGKVYRALRYTDPDNHTDYYMPMGNGLSKIFLLSIPVEEYTRISSPFGERRHPISRRKSFHAGIDYAAPWGTPVFAAGDATVKFVGRKGGYGKSIVLEHHGRVETLYAHLAKYAKGLKAGQKVTQNQTIGYVGQSGRATGPHLHYEIKLDNVPLDPILAEQPINMPIAEANKANFIEKTQRLVAKLDAITQSSPTKLAQNAHSLLTTPSTATIEETSLKQHLVAK